MTDDPRIAPLFAEAEAAHAARRTEEAFAHLEAVLAIDPDHPRALNTLAGRAMEQGELDGARDMYARAAARAPDQPSLWLNLAIAAHALKDDTGERDALDKAIAADPYFLPGRWQLGQLLERQRDIQAAAHQYNALLSSAPPEHQLPEALRQALPHARAVVQREAAAFDAAMTAHLAAAREKVAPAARTRVDTAIDALVGKRRIYASQPTGLHIPFLPALEFFPREHFPWLADIEARSDAIRDEFLELLAGDAGFTPYIDYAPGTPVNQWAKLNHSPDWSALFLWRDGERREGADKCPATVTTLERIPRLDIKGRGPTAFFSLLKPKTRIPAHTGVTNARVIVHLPLIVPEGCGFRVGGETRQWREGEALAFDDTIEHEAWNDSSELRAVLIFDVWNPFLDENERELVRHAVAGMLGYQGAKALTEGH